MKIIVIISIIIALLAIIFLIININKTSYQMLLVKIQESKRNIEFFLNKKEELLSSIIEEIKKSNKKKYDKQDILKDLIKNKNIKQNSYEKDNNLRLNLNELNELIEDDDNLLKNQNLKKIYLDIKNTETDLTASKKYFNKTVDDIDKLFKKFPKKFMKGILKYNKIEKYTIRKNIQFEILKEEKEK